MQRKIFTQVRFNQSDFMYHLIFWLFLFFLHWHNFFYSNIKGDSVVKVWWVITKITPEMFPKAMDALSTANITIFSCVISSYIHSYYVLPKTIGNTKISILKATTNYICLAFILSILSCAMFESLFFLRDLLWRPVIIEFNHNWERNFPESFFNMYLLTGLVYIRKWFHNSEDLRLQNELLEKENLLLEKDSKIKDYKVRLLNQQLKPHFLFNSLNHIYLKSLQNPSAVPEIVEKFSTVLRYIVYECNYEKVSLIKELEFIKTFVDIEIQGLDESTFIKEINIDRKCYNKDLEIAPLLLLPIIENGVKYGIKKTETNKWLKINITINENNMLTLNMKNSQSNQPEGIHIEGSGFGIGIKNLRDRLKTFYSQKHELTLNDKIDEFESILTIKL